MTVMDAQIEKVLEEARRGRMWGNIQIDFQDGQPVVIRKTETFKIRVENNGSDHYRTNPK